MLFLPSSLISCLLLSGIIVERWPKDGIYIIIRSQEQLEWDWALKRSPKFKTSFRLRQRLGAASIAPEQFGGWRLVTWSMALGCYCTKLFS